jgi:hypothetical protein
MLTLRIAKSISCVLSITSALSSPTSGKEEGLDYEKAEAPVHNGNGEPGLNKLHSEP